MSVLYHFYVRCMCELYSLTNVRIQCVYVLLMASLTGITTHTYCPPLLLSLSLSLSQSVIWCVSLCIHSLSMSLYFFLRMETWSLNNTGSNLIWECTSGMKPSQ